MPDSWANPWPLGDHATGPAVVAWRGETPVLRETLLADVTAAAHAVAALDVPDVAVFDTDSYRFAVWLLAAWQVGLAVTVPGDALPATRAALPQPWVGDVAGAALSDWVAAAPDERTPPTPSAPSVRAIGTPSLQVFTSGSTGQPSAIAKTLVQLRNETDALEAAFGHTLPADARIVATVPHQHLYGLLFRVLWPLAAGRAFDCDTLAYPESVWSLPAGRTLALVASPAILKRIPTVPDRGPVAARFAAVFSSGGPLPAEANLAARALLGTRITEVYGSSETGGIAHRHDPQDAWTPQPGVELALDDGGLLQVRSPFLATAGWLTTSDRVTFDGGRFTLLGRADRIVKVEEKRISLSRIEQLLGACNEVDTARTLLLSRQRDEVAAVVVLSAAGREALARDGKAPLDKRLRDALAGDIERVGLPRRWRYVAELPHNGMGKTPEALLAALFAPPTEPEIVTATVDTTGVTLILKIDARLAHFDGHFDAAPVLPGVAQVDWAVRYGRRHFPIDGGFTGMRALKFQRIVQPGMTLTLTLGWDAAKRQLAFAYTSGAGAHSSGKLVFDGMPGGAGE
ncbi:AMP-binding protein [Jeongeupia chitinilytica]|uniref:AMP-binding protein n=1 Tax=Jeongeupia chitinilytica TaxID=1041641 RepID=A0ABQ3H547_9NEIS|nr:AMP-binding protein [Jeongeupia chitinilytica]GHD69009.1 AMP-binding protein [Jeongeupia chitinilytica]